MNKFENMTVEEMNELDGGIGLVAGIAIGAGCLLGGTGLGLGTAWVVSNIGKEKPSNNVSQVRR